MPSLVAGAALLVDYVLTVAVSVTAGVLALTSAVPSLEPHKVGLSLGFVVLLTIVNLRGVRESGVLFALPTYGFVAVMFLMVGTGIGKCLDGSCPQAAVPESTRSRGGSGRRARDPAGVRLGQRRAHRCGGDLERSRRLPTTQGDATRR